MVHVCLKVQVGLFNSLACAPIERFTLKLACKMFVLSALLVGFFLCSVTTALLPAKVRVLVVSACYLEVQKCLSRTRQLCG